MILPERRNHTPKHKEKPLTKEGGDSEVFPSEAPVFRKGWMLRLDTQTLRDYQPGGTNSPEDELLNTWWTAFHRAPVSVLRWRRSTHRQTVGLKN